MCKREGIFFGMIFFWLIMIFIEILIFPGFAKNFGVYMNILPVAILVVIIIPRYFSKKYNNWLESDLFKKKEKYEN
jgi:hypothetical protein